LDRSSKICGCPHNRRFKPKWCGSKGQTKATLKNDEIACGPRTWLRCGGSKGKALVGAIGRVQPSTSVLEEVVGANEEHGETSGWDQGHLWRKTQSQLRERGLKAESNHFRNQCPQLLRLAPDTVLETADWVIQEFGRDYLESEPRLLGYRVEHVQYGLEFMHTMMMTKTMADAKAACQASPALLLSGIDGGYSTS